MASPSAELQQNAHAINDFFHGAQFDMNSPNAFAELLAEFTISSGANNILSPAAMSPPNTNDPSTATASHELMLLHQQLQQVTGDAQQQTHANFSDEHSLIHPASGQNHGGASSGMNGGSSASIGGSGGGNAGSSSASAGGEGPVNQLAQAIAGMDQKTSTQLLAALLARHQAQAMAEASMPSALPSPSSYQQHPASNHGSPLPFNAHYAVPQQAMYSPSLPPNYNPHYGQLQQQAQFSLPPSLVSSPLASPYFNGPQIISQQPQTSFFQTHPQQQHVPSPTSASVQAASQSAPTAFQNAFSSRGQPGTAGQQADEESWRGSTKTGASYATTADTEDWTENDFMFSPLMSPAMTPQTVYSAQSSAFTPINPNNLITPAELFTSLGSPAMLPPTNYVNDQTNVPSGSASPWTNPTSATVSAAHSRHGSLSQSINSLQNLVEQTQALEFSNALHQQQQRQAQSSQPPSAVGSPVLPPDAGSSTATGSGRRGASVTNKKARPSPLLKPTPDSSLSSVSGLGNGMGGSANGGTRRKKSMSSEGSKRSESRGRKSATSSPFLGATTSFSPLVVAALSQSQTQSGARSSNGSNGSPGDGNNTPSPVDLAMSDAGKDGRQQHELQLLHHQQQQIQFQHQQHQQHLLQQQSLVQEGRMGPPPAPLPAIPSLPSTSSASSTPRPSNSRRTSSNSVSQQQNGGDWMMQPVTPASLMNFTTDIASAGLNLSTSSKASSVNGRDTGEKEKSSGSKKAGRKANDVDSAGADGDASTSATSTTTTKKGKSRAGSVSSAPPTTSVPPRKVQIKPAPIAPSKATTSATAQGSQKIKPLLASGLPADALARLSTKSNYQNIMDGRGVDLLGLDPSTVSALSATQGAGADIRRTSHKAAEQKRRDSLKQCFEQLRRILPPLAPGTIEEEKRPGEGNVGGQRSGSIDPENPNRGVSKAALLRRSNEYIGVLHERIERRDAAIDSLRLRIRELKEQLGVDEEGFEVEGLDLDNLDKDEKAAGTMAFYEGFDSDDEIEVKPKPPRKTPGSRRKSASSMADAEFKLKSGTVATGARRSTRNSNASVVGGMDEDGMDGLEEASAAMDVEE